jgi:hypothetical protein
MIASNSARSSSSSAPNRARNSSVSRTGAATVIGNTQALRCLRLSLVPTAIRRGFAVSATGIRRVSTPAS